MCRNTEKVDENILGRTTDLITTSELEFSKNKSTHNLTKLI